MINISKGQKINLSKETSIKGGKFKVGLGFGMQGRDVDLDSYVVVRNAAGKVIDFIYYSNFRGSGITHNGDDVRGGGDPNKPNETIDISLSNLSSDAALLTVGVAIYSGASNLKDLSTSFANIESNGQEVARYNLNENFGSYKGVEIADIILRNGEWILNARGEGYDQKFTEYKSLLYSTSYSHRGDANMNLYTSRTSSSQVPSEQESTGFFGAIKKLFS